MSLKEIGEFGLIDRIKTIVDRVDDSVVAGIGDDAAVLKSPTGALTLISTDTLIEGVHFDLSYFTYFQVGWRAAAANLSDIAAMGGKPKYLLVSIGLPRTVQPSSVEELFRGAGELCRNHNTIIIGGDTTLSPDRLFISMTILGQVDENHLALRSGAKPGDGLFLTGRPGSAKAGFKILSCQKKMHLKDKYSSVVSRHLLPLPRVPEAQFLVAFFSIHAMIDVSDGVASEVHHICKQSNVGAKISLEKLPQPEDVVAVAALFKDEPNEYVLSGGEDFELLFTTDIDEGEKLSVELRSRFGLECSLIGEIVSVGEGVRIIDPQGKGFQLKQSGWNHFKQDAS